MLIGGAESAIVKIVSIRILLCTGKKNPAHLVKPNFIMGKPRASQIKPRGTQSLQ